MLIKASLVFPLALALSPPLLAGEREMALDTIPAGATVELGGSRDAETPHGASLQWGALFVR